MAGPATPLLTLPFILKALGYGTVGYSALSEVAEGNLPEMTARSVLNPIIGAVGLQTPEFRRWQEANPVLSTATEFGGLFKLGSYPYKLAKQGNIFSRKTYDALSSDRVGERIGALAKLESPLAIAHAASEGWKAGGDRDFDVSSALTAGAIDAGVIGGLGALNLPKQVSRIFGDRTKITNRDAEGSVIPQIAARKEQANIKQLRSVQDLIRSTNPKTADVYAGEIQKAEQRLASRQEEILRGDQEATGEVKSRTGFGVKVPRDERGIPQRIGQLKDGDNQAINSAIQRGIGTKTDKAKFLNINEIQPDENGVTRDIIGNAALQESLWVDLKQALPHLFNPTLSQRKKDITPVISKNMRNVGDGTYLAQEKSGMYVVAKRLHDRDLQHTWLITKTDKPSMFINQKYLDDAEALTEQQTIDALSLADDASTPMFNNALSKIGSTYREFARNPVIGGYDFSSVTDVADRHIVPALHQLRDSPLGRHSLNVIVKTFQEAGLLTNTLLRGTQEFGRGVKGSIGLQDFHDAPDSLSGLARVLNDDEWTEVSRIIAQTQEEQARIRKLGAPTDPADIDYVGAASRNVRNFLQKHLEVMNGRVNELRNTADKTGADPNELFDLSNSFHIAGAKMPKFMSYVFDSNGNIIHRGVGDSKSDSLRAVGDKTGSRVTLRVGESAQDLQADKKIRKYNADNPIIKTKPRATTATGFGGVRVSTGVDLDGVPLDYKTYMEQTHQALSRLNNEIASRTSRFIIAPSINKLNLEGDHHAMEVITDRLRQYEGATISVPGKLVDQGAARVFQTTPGQLQKNVGVYNAIENGFRLAFDLAHAFMNVTGFAIMGSTMTSLIRAGAFDTVSRVMPSLLTKVNDKYVPVSDNGYMRNLFRSWGQIMEPDAELMELMREGLSTGRLRQIPVERGDDTFFDNRLVSLKDSLRDPNRNMLGKTMDSLKYAANVTLGAPEQLARLMAYSFGRNIAREHLGITDFKDIREFVNEFVDMTMHRYGAPDRAALFSGATGSNAGLFKTWALGTVNQMYLGAHGIGELVSKGERAKALNTTMKFATHNAILAGGLGTPLVGAPLAAYQLYDEDADADIEAAIVDNIGDGFVSDLVMYGLPSAMGWSTFNRARLPGSEVLRDAQMLTNVIVADRIEQLGNAYQAIADHETRGDPRGILDNPQVMNSLARGIAPKIVHRTIQVAQGLDTNEFVHHRTGYPVSRNFTLSDRIGYMLGFNPTELDQNYQLASVLWRDQRARTEKLKEFGKALYDANGDAVATDAILRKAQVEGVDIEKIVRSLKTRRKEAGLDHVERALDAEGLQKFQTLFNRYKRND